MKSFRRSIFIVLSFFLSFVSPVYAADPMGLYCIDAFGDAGQALRFELVATDVGYGNFSLYSKKK